jgi:hypothetical protein
MSPAPSARAWPWIAALCVVPLLPLLDAAVSIDAPVFLAVTRQILESPGDPFGFEMVWDPTSPYTHQFNRNPPLLSYWLAPAVLAFGEWEPALHAALLPFPLLAGLSFYGIARRLAGDGLGPAALLVATPAFLVLASTLMLDVPVLAFMLLSVYALLRGRDGSRGWQLAAGAAAAAAGLTKYVGLSSAPLLGAGVWLLYRRRGGAALRVLGVPLAAWAAWGAYTAHRYGAVHFFDSTDVLFGQLSDPDEFWNQIASVPIFYGCALVFPLFVWARALAGRTPGAELAVVGAALGAAAVGWVLPGGEPPRRHPLGIEEAVFAAGGLAAGFALWLPCLDPRRLRGDPERVWLVLWLAGVGFFSLLLNWHVNAADALLAAPPVILLLFRDERRRPPRRVLVAWVAAMLPLAFALAWADSMQAGVYRTAARRIAAEIGERANEGWFVGHWGFQHYLEQIGFRPVVPPTYERQYGPSRLAKGDWVASARNVSQLDVTQHMSRYQIRPVWNWSDESWLPLRTHNADAGAGFYSHHTGYVPFAWSRLPLDQIGLGRVAQVLTAPEP